MSSSQNPQENKNKPIFHPDALLINSLNYVERELDEKCKRAIKENAAFVRLKGVHKIGKTSLLYRIIEEGNNENYSTIFIDFEFFKPIDLDNVHNFCIKFCTEIASELQKQDKTKTYVDNFDNGNSQYLKEEFFFPHTHNKFESEEEILSSTTIAKDYFEQKFLNNDNNILLVMDNIDKVFEKEAISQEIGNMLAEWYKNGKLPTPKGEKWSKLKMVVAHATDYYAGSQNINESPLKGIGIVPNEDEFDFQKKEIEQLASIYEINLESNDIEKICNYLGGHPYLIQLAFKHLYDRNDVSDFFDIASTNSSPFIQYLRDELLFYLRNDPKYKQAFIEILTTQSNTVDDELELQKIEFKLGALGLIKKEGNKILPRCQLYKDYFRRVLIKS